uniref:Si:dkey-30c15.13 n=1 Tax=Xiphophorus maculatus TaxID=8083 RepID=A0A3B5QW67_XIPMA
MMQNMFQEGLYQVFFKETPPASPSTETSNTNNENLTNVRIHRWFGTVVNTRLLVTGVIQVLSALASILTTVSHACVSYGCSVVMVTPVWSSLSYAAAGCLAVEVQRKAGNIKIIILMTLNIFSLLFGFAALLANSLASVEATDLSSYQQAGSNVVKATYIVFTSLCFLGTFYILFLCWRGLRRYSSRNVKAYIRISQVRMPPEPKYVLLTVETRHV